MRYVLDTGAFWKPDVLKAVARLGRQLVMPAVAYAERLRQVEERRQDVERFHLGLTKLRVQIEPFGKAQAQRFCVKLPKAKWDKHAREAMIAGHLERGDLLLTPNASDFLLIGVPADRIRSI